MATAMTGPLDGAAHSSQAVPWGGPEWPRFTPLESAERDAPRLHMPPAMTVARDRWERLMTVLDIPAAPEAVWSALSEPTILRSWFALCRGSLLDTERDWVLDFEDGEFFLCRTLVARPASELRYLWRWIGIGQATCVTWRLDPSDMGTRVSVTEEAFNPPWDWQTWNGGGWPGILEQLAAHLRTGMDWRWPWRRMGPYVQVELPLSMYDAWDRLFTAAGLRYWLQVMQGTFAAGQPLTLMMGDASGLVNMLVREVIEPGRVPPSFLPRVGYGLNRPIWNADVGGQIWIDPSGWERCILQAVHYNWENLPAELQLSERKIMAAFWAGAARRAQLLCSRRGQAAGPHSWS